ncbi:MAG TPA: hypothetical protein VNL16_00105, partial [Chloroflexota bacterium]|nr:hypothetical protein [Chloroflexota bacterium]
ANRQKVLASMQAEHERLRAEYDAFLADHGHDGCAAELSKVQERLAAVRAKLDKAIAAAPTTTMDNPDVLPTVLDLVDEARALCDGPEGPQIG